MIKINLQKVTETFQIGDKTYEADFNDEALKKYFKQGQKIWEYDKQVSEKYPDIENTDDFGKVCAAAIDVLPARAESYKSFFNETFGEGTGEKIYAICGKSTPNMQKVFMEVWKVIYRKVMDIETESDRAAKKYVKNRNQKR
ncbi:DUF6673 family protein [Heyndrickxia coagulans]|uniref:DUF6673 family protein n=1 Tax=Heyndrickxia coagulans TaxID=1398 RepID=UPI0008F966F0|nr:DUF6673 family protein [Heyndrickxia coagulans]APB37982.1 hypothetical protein BIZ35_15260 [Heyndrickxia coagulans]WNE61801.1 hypothetical protein KIY57_01260 [Heyndrickxia coagulans]